MQTDYLQFIFQAINNLLTQNLGFFDAMGQNLFRMFATILVVWYGVKSALSAASGRHFLHFDNFAALLLTISFGFGMVNYYSTPIPGMGRSFHNLVTDEAQFLSGKIDQNSLQSVEQGITDFEARIDAPGVTDLLGTAIYVVVVILLAGCPGHRVRGNRIRIHRHRRLCSGRADLYPLLHCSEARMALLGMVQGIYPICLLSGNCFGRRFHHRKPADRHPPVAHRREHSLRYS